MDLPQVLWLNDYAICLRMVLLAVRTHDAVVTNNGYLPCEPTVHILVMVLLTLLDQMDKNSGRLIV